MAEVQQYIFFDFEMLCSNRGMAFTNMEAIRLGAVKYDLETESVTYFDRFIQPTSLKPLSKFCKQLTGITDANLADANNFKEVFADFLTWIGGVKKSRFFSWSTSDLSRLLIDAEKHEIPSTTIKKIEKRYIDFQAIFTKRVTKHHFSVENALELFGLTFQGEKHNPMYDAYNTLRIYLNFLDKRLDSDLIMLQQFILDDVPTELNEINATVNHYLKRDVHLFLEQLTEMFKMNDALKIIKKTRKLVEKYENVLINRSRLFSQEIVDNTRLLVEFYHDLLVTYDEHMNYSSKIMILDESVILPLNELSLKRG